AGAFVVTLAARRSWFCCHQLVAVLLRFGRRRTGLADVAALGRAFSWGAVVGGEACGRSPCVGLRPGRVGRWAWADRPCGIGGLLGLWPLGRCRAGRVIPSVGGVPESCSPAPPCSAGATSPDHPLHHPSTTSLGDEGRPGLCKER